MDVIAYGAIKNLDKKLGMSMGEVKNNFAITVGDKLLNFDGFTDVGVEKSLKNPNTRTSYGFSSIYGHPLLYHYWDNATKTFIGVDDVNFELVRINPTTKVRTVLRTLTSTFVATLKSTLTGTKFQSSNYNWQFSPDGLKLYTHGLTGSNPSITFYSVIVDFTALTLTEKSIARPSTISAGFTGVTDGASYRYSNSWYDWSTNKFYIMWLQQQLTTNNWWFGFCVYDQVANTFTFPSGLAQNSTSTGGNRIEDCRIAFDRVAKKAYVYYFLGGGTNANEKPYVTVFTLEAATSSAPAICTTTGFSPNGVQAYLTIFDNIVNGNIYAIYSNTAMTRDVYPTPSRNTIVVKIPVTIPTAIEILANDLMIGSDMASTGLQHYSQTNFGARYDIIEQGDRILIYNTQDTNSNGAFFFAVIDTVKKKLVTNLTSNALFVNAMNNVPFYVIEADLTNLAFDLVDVGASTYWMVTTTTVTGFGESFYNNPYTSFSRTGEVFVFLRHSTSITIDLTVDGRFFPNFTFGAEGTAIHSKNGLSFKVLGTTALNETYWGTK